MYSITINGKSFSFKTEKRVFYPTATSELLIKCVCSKIKQPGKLLDLGCGIGVVGIILSKLGLAEQPFYASDLSERAAAITIENAADYGCKVFAKAGSLFEPWEGELFDYIVDDISGVAEDIAMISPWFKDKVSCDSGKDGTNLVGKIIKDAPKHLKQGGIFFFPALSLSNTKKLVAIAEENFAHVEKIAQKKWLLPEDMMEHISLLKELNHQGMIKIEQKYGLIFWYTDIYAAYN